MAPRKFSKVILLLSCLAHAIKCIDTEKDVHRREGKICIGTNGRMSVPNNRSHHYRNLRDRYTNCTYVDGNLELTWLKSKDVDLSFLQHIREVTGYVLISHVDVPIVLPSLQIIRGRTLFKLSVHDDEFALMVTLSKMDTLEMPALRDILEGSVGILNNYNLCHIKTIEWNEIINTQSYKYLYVYNFAEPERDCTPCHESCEAGCWGEGPHNCQKFSKTNCSPQCHGGRCFGSKPRECCHLFCAGGCTGPKQSDCLACKNFYDDGVCKQECPPMQIYNPTKYRWEKNPEGKYAYGATCVKDCPKHLLKDNGACVRSCPPKKKAENGECVPCEGVCPKICQFQGQNVHGGNIESFRNCTVIEGSITILDQTFNGYREIYTNYTFGPSYPAMDPSKLEVFSTVKEITGYLDVQADHPKFKTLEAFRNLEVVGGRSLTEYFAALYIVKTSLTSLGLRSLRKIRTGSVVILENDDLCYAESINWNKIMKSSSHNALLQNNKESNQCHVEGQVCNAECSSEGCWGPGNTNCLSCKNFQVGNECIERCDPNLGLYTSGGGQCKKCDSECDTTCKGPGPTNCHKCKNAKDGPFCVPECPVGKYISPYGECLECHNNCVNGCTGPENTIGSNGCNSCEKAIINTDHEVVQCLRESDVCPEGFFYEWVVPTEQGKMKALAGKAVCRPCHPLCKRCNGYGFHKDVCQECVQFEQDEQCATECSNDYFVQDQKCLACADECNGCRGPSNTECIKCKFYKIFPDGVDPNDNGTTAFTCAKQCPPEAPHKITNDNGDPFCSAEDIFLGRPLTAENPTGAIIGGVIGCIVLFGIFGSVLTFQWRRSIKAKENTAKMAMVLTGYEENEALHPTNIKPNVKQLKTIKLSELRTGEPLGYGAFGTVWKGVWIPEGENVKIPVAVKKLKEGTVTNPQEVLDEAYIMASIEHPNLLSLLGICMASEISLVTQLMPLGNLLTFVQKHKSSIGSLHLLRWCKQIAQGMAYLEENQIVHRDLAARNVLIQSPHCVKITDFGLARLLEQNQDEYRANGGRMPIKWLALECIEKRIFTHKSDVWAFGVTIWELFTFGGKPYENIPAKDLQAHLAGSGRLPQPPICTLDIFMIMIKCWTDNPDHRPSFKTLVQEFTRMAKDPGTYLVIEGDAYMKLPAYSLLDEKELIKKMAMDLEGPGRLMHAEEYLNPGKINSQQTLNTPVDTPVQPSTPTQKFFPPAGFHPSVHRNSRYSSSSAVNDMNTLGRNNMYYGSSHISASLDPLRQLEDDHCVDGPDSYPVGRSGTLHSQKSVNRSVGGPARPVTVAGLNLNLPVDEEDYLVPSPQSPPPFQSAPPINTPTNNNAYMDLISDPKGVTMFPYPPPQGIFVADNPSNYGRVPDYFNGGGFISMDNPEYILDDMKQRQGNYHTLGIPIVHSSSSPSSSHGPSSIHSAPGVTSHHPTYASLSSSSSGGPYKLAAVPKTSIAASGLNGVINPMKVRGGSGSTQPRSSEEEMSDDHEYYNDFDRLKREQQPLYPTRTSAVMPPTTAPPRNETTV